MVHGHYLLNKYNAYPEVKSIIVTENGAAFDDIVIDGEIKDTARTLYLQQYINEVLKARHDGVKVDGYFAWSLTDNFEWAEGYYPRFGLVHIDFSTQRRTIKESGRFYGELVRNHPAEIADIMSGLMSVYR